MSRRDVLGFAAIACVACCIGPILGVLGAIATLGAVSCATSPEPVPLELTRPAP